MPVFYEVAGPMRQAVTKQQGSVPFAWLRRVPGSAERGQPGCLRRRAGPSAPGAAPGRLREGRAEGCVCPALRVPGGMADSKM